MRASWFMTLAAGAAIAIAGQADVEAQTPREVREVARRAREQQQQRREEAREQERRGESVRQQQQRREQVRQQQQRRESVRQQEARREAERDRLRRERERNQRAVWQDRDRDRRDGRIDSRRRSGDDDDDDGGDDDDDDYDDDDDDNRRRSSVYGNGNGRRGPAFCRSGEGHPVYGRAWCRDRGYDLGNERSRDIWGDIIFRQPRDRRYDNRQLSRSTLGSILGSGVLGSFETYGRQYRTSSGGMTGRWLPDSRTNVLQLYMGSTPIARLVDTNRDGRVDSVLLR